MSQGSNFAVLSAVLTDTEKVMERWMDLYESSALRIPGSVDRGAVASTAQPIVDALAALVAPDRDGHVPEILQFLPGAPELREVEKAVSFAAANLGASDFTGFDVGALIFALRDVLTEALAEQGRREIQRYMEWLAVLAGDSLATARSQARLERWHDELDEGTPLIMITPELPAVLFVCAPDSRVVSGLFGRLLLTVVRTGARAAILDVRGMSGGMTKGFADALERFLGHRKVAGQMTVLASGVRAGDVDSWQEMGERCGATLIFENHFDVCVATAIRLGGWRLFNSQ